MSRNITMQVSFNDETDEVKCELFPYEAMSLDLSLYMLIVLGEQIRAAYGLSPDRFF